MQDFAPAPNSVLHLESLEQLPKMMEQLHYLMKNDTAYDEMHAYKRDGPTDRFMALVDLGITHPDCRLCITLADRQRVHERHDKPKDRPCACKDSDKGEPASQRASEAVPPFHGSTPSPLVVLGGRC